MILIDLSEVATKMSATKKKPQGLRENIRVAKIDGNVAKIAKDELEEQLGESVVNKDNKLNYEYLDDSKIIDLKK